MPNETPLKPNDFPVEVQGTELVTADGKPIAKAETPAVAEDIADVSMKMTAAKNRTNGRPDRLRLPEPAAVCAAAPAKQVRNIVWSRSTGGGVDVDHVSRVLCNQFRSRLRSRKSRISGTISSALSSSAKWPVSSRWSSAFGQIALVGMRAVGGKDLVVLAPDDQRRRLIFAEVCLHGRIERQVGPVVVEEIHLDLGVARPIEQRLVVHPVVGRDAADVRDAVGVLELRGLRRHQHMERLAVRVRAVGPVGLDRIPELLQPLLVGIAVLDDQAR